MKKEDIKHLDRWYENLKAETKKRYETNEERNKKTVDIIHTLKNVGLHDITSDAIRKKGNLHLYDAVLSNSNFKIVYAYCPNTGWYRRYVKCRLDIYSPWNDYVATGRLNKTMNRKSTLGRYAKEVIREYNLNTQIINSLSAVMHYRKALPTRKLYILLKSKSFAC